MRVTTKRTKDKQHLPESETYFVEFCQFNRVGREEFNQAVATGGRALGDAMLRHGISDFLLPGDEADLLQYTGTDQDWIAYNGLDEELENWCLLGVARLNKVRLAGTAPEAAEPAAAAEDDGLGNSASSPSDCSAGSDATGCESDAPAKAP